MIDEFDKIKIGRPDGTHIIVTVSKDDSRVLAHFAKMSRTLEKRIEERYSEMHDNTSVYGQITSGQFRIDANDILDILDDIIEEMAIGMEAEYIMKKGVEDGEGEDLF